MSHIHALTIIPSKQNSLSPWLNGTGLTRQIAIFPSGASMLDFDWRISVADIESNCAYSNFAHTHRLQMLLSGDGIVLTLPSKVCVLNQQYQCVDFSGDDLASCYLLKHPCQVLNVMLQSHLAPPQINVLRGAYSKTLDHLQRVFYIAKGVYKFVTLTGEDVAVKAGDALLVEANQYHFSSAASHDGVMIEITFH